MSPGSWTDTLSVAASVAAQPRGSDGPDGWSPEGVAVVSELGPAGSSLLDLPDFGTRQSLRDQVGHALRAALVAGRMKPGVVYSAPVLATGFGVSATPVREAMLDLVTEGLVEPVRNKGFRVTELSAAELDEMASIRELIEVPTVALITREHADALAGAAAELREIAATIVDGAERGDLIAYIEADRRFHLTLLGLAGNGHLVRVIGDLRARSRLYGLQNLSERGALVASALEHDHLLDLMLAGDADAAAATMHAHIAKVRGSWAGDA